MHICRCCAGKMVAGSPRNPHICISCEQLLEDDCMELDALLASVVAARGQRLPEHSQESQELPSHDSHDPHETFSGPI